MEKRKMELSTLQSYIKDVDKEVTMILQNLQWDRNTLTKSDIMVTCKYDTNHRIRPEKKEIHERECLLKQHGYSKQDIMLPDPPDPNAKTLVKFSYEEIQKIIDVASKINPLFRKGCGHQGLEPLTVERLQATYTGDELCAIHDAVVKAVPSCHDLADLALPSVNNEDQKNTKPKSRMEILAELRDMKRRRTKYRVPAKTCNYSDVLRDVIKTQMDLYTDVQTNKSPDNSVTNKIDATKNDKQYGKIEKSLHRAYNINSNKSYNKNRRESEDRYEDKRGKDNKKYECDYKMKRDRDDNERNVKWRKGRNGDEYEHKRLTRNQESASHNKEYYEKSREYRNIDRYKSSNAKNSSCSKDYDRSNDRRYSKEKYGDSRQERYTHNVNGSSSRHKRSCDQKYGNWHNKHKYKEDNDSSDRVYKRYYDT